MKKFIKVSLVIPAAVSWSLATASFAHADTTNYGQCHTYTTSDSAQAPGQTGNGPSTQSSTGSTQQPAAFNGWMMCSK